MLNVDALPMTPSMQDSAAGTAGGPPCAMGLYCVAECIRQLVQKHRGSRLEPGHTHTQDILPVLSPRYVVRVRLPRTGVPGVLNRYDANSTLEQYR